MPRLKNYYPGSAGWAPLVDLDSVKAVCDQHGLNEEQTDRALNAVDLFVLKTASRQDGLTAADAKAHLEGLAAAMKQAAHALGPLTRANALIMRLEYEDWQVLDALNSRMPYLRKALDGLADEVPDETEPDDHVRKLYGQLIAAWDDGERPVNVASWPGSASPMVLFIAAVQNCLPDEVRPELTLKQTADRVRRAYTRKASN